jgi:hypothetical protein
VRLNGIPVMEPSELLKHNTLGRSNKEYVLKTDQREPGLRCLNKHTHESSCTFFPCVRLSSSYPEAIEWARDARSCAAVGFALAGSLDPRHVSKGALCMRTRSKTLQDPMRLPSSSIPPCQSEQLGFGLHLVKRGLADIQALQA